MTTQADRAPCLKDVQLLLATLDTHRARQYFSVPHIFRLEPIGATRYHSDSEQTANFRSESTRNPIGSEQFQSDSEWILSGMLEEN